LARRPAASQIHSISLLGCYGETTSAYKGPFQLGLLMFLRSPLACQQRGLFAVLLRLHGERQLLLKRVGECVHAVLDVAKIRRHFPTVCLCDRPC